MRKRFSTLGFGSLVFLGLGLFPGFAQAASGWVWAGVPFEFVLFALVLLGVAVFHHHTLGVALLGLVGIVAYKLGVAGFKAGSGWAGLGMHFAHEWVTLANLLCLLMGFALLARHFEKSHIPVILPQYLPDDWKGGFVLLAMVWALSAFLDNIAAAMIGGAMAHQLFRAKVHVGYLAGIVAASNAGGSWSVVGDTTTTMIWIAGAQPSQVMDAFLPSVVALLIVGYVAAHQQHAYSPILKDRHAHTHIDWPRVGIVGGMLAAAMGANVLTNAVFPEQADRFPFIGVAVWVALLLSVRVRRPDWEVLPETFKSALFLLSLVGCASLMPVESLPAASWHTTLGLGFVSAVFDNIPLTALALHQGGYDWGFLAYAVGFGGSMIWFGSSAGVALSSSFPQARSTLTWLRQGWHVALAYGVSFGLMVLLLQWHPEPLRQTPNVPATPVAPAMSHHE